MSDVYIGTKIPNLISGSALHIGTSSTAADTLELRIKDAVTGMTMERILEFFRQVEMALIQGSIAGTKFTYPFLK